MDAYIAGFGILFESIIYFFFLAIFLVIIYQVLRGFRLDKDEPITSKNRWFLMLFRCLAGLNLALMVIISIVIYFN